MCGVFHTKYKTLRDSCIKRGECCILLLKHIESNTVEPYGMNVKGAE